MTYEEFRRLYKTLVTELLSDKEPRVTNMIFSKNSAEICEELTNLCEEYPEYEERVDSETWNEINGCA